MTIPEEWRPVVGYEGLYEVSNLGRVRRLPVKILRSDGRMTTSKSGLMSPTPREYGHLFVSLFKDKKRKTDGVHRLVCEAFHGPAPEGKPWALHKNDVAGDNTPENLYWGDGFDNQRDSVQNGTHSQAKKTHCTRGHALLGNNLYRYPSGKRSCRECMRASTRQWRKNKERGEKT